jgi:hypothetical protein
LTQKNRKVASEQGGNHVMSKVSPDGTEGGRRPTIVAFGEMVVVGLKLGQCFPAPRKQEVVISIYRGDPMELLLRE